MLQDDRDELAVPFARDPAGRLIDAEAADPASIHSCPACASPLTLRQGEFRRPHFAHRPSADCTHAAETALHAFAKQAIAGALRLSLPDLILQKNRLVTRVVDAREHRFDRAELEASFKGLRIDVLLWSGDDPLAVEIKVSHAVDTSKAARLADAGMSCIEIDLSRAVGHVVEASRIEKYTLETAPRVWINHRRVSQAQAKLDKEALAADAEFRDRIVDNDVVHGPEAVAEIESLIERFGLQDLIGFDIPAAHWLRGPARLWQAEALRALVVDPALKLGPRALHLPHDLATALPGFLIRRLPRQPSLHELRIAGLTQHNWGTASIAVSQYLALIANEGRLVRYDAPKRRWARRIEDVERIRAVAPEVADDATRRPDHAFKRRLLQLAAEKLDGTRAAERFLSRSLAALGGVRPLDYCRDEKTFNVCANILSSTAERRKHGDWTHG